MKCSKLHQIRISDDAYHELRRLAEMPEFKGRRAVGVLDYLILGKFSTNGSGRPKKKC